MIIRASPRHLVTPSPCHSVVLNPAIFRGKYYLDARGQYRVFNAAGYRFYRSNSAPPEEGDSPFDTNATLPHEPTDVYADGTWYLSVSYFDGVLDSGFLPLGPAGETFLRLDLSGGAVSGSPPAGPLDWRVEAAAGGAVRVVGLYVEAGSLRADQWAIAYSIDGSTPAADAPDLSVAVPADGLAVLDYSLPAQNHGTTVKVRLQTSRNDDPPVVYSEGSEVKTITADAVGPSVPVGGSRWTGQRPL